MSTLVVIEAIDSDWKLHGHGWGSSNLYRLKSQGLRIGMYSFSGLGKALRFFLFSPAVSESLNFRLQRLFYNLRKLADVELSCYFIIFFFDLLQIGAPLLF